MTSILNGSWTGQQQQKIIKGAFIREQSKFDTQIDDETKMRLRTHPEEFIVIASRSCPWSHRITLTLTLTGLIQHIPIHYAGGPRTEGYRLMPHGPLHSDAKTPFIFVHELYTKTTPSYSGRSTVPILWDQKNKQIISNESDCIVKAISMLAQPNQPTLYPLHMVEKIEHMNKEIQTNLSNAVYKAGFAQTQNAYDTAVNSVFKMMDRLEERLANRKFLFDPVLTISDLYLFCTLVRFDAVYFTHFRCSYKRLVDYPALWRYARQLFQLPGIGNTVNFPAILEGYYLNDGDHNPHKLIGRLPFADWNEPVS